MDSGGGPGRETATLVDVANKLASEAVSAFIREHPSPNYNSPSATLQEYLSCFVETAEDDYDPLDELWHDIADTLFDGLRSSWECQPLVLNTATQDYAQRWLEDHRELPLKSFIEVNRGSR
jgi:hypothetical protein